MHATFTVDGIETKLFLVSDVGHEVLTDIVDMTESKNNHGRLEWDLFKLPHHCSHHSLSSKPRGGDKSEPEPKVVRLFEHWGGERESSGSSGGRARGTGLRCGESERSK